MFDLNDLRGMLPELRDGAHAALQALKPKVGDQAYVVAFTETGPSDADLDQLADGNEDAVAAALCGVMQQLVIVCDAVAQVIGAPIPDEEPEP